MKQEKFFLYLHAMIRKIMTIKWNNYDAIYFNVHKYILMSIGLWPLQSKTGKLFSFMIYGVSSVSLIIALAAGLAERCNGDRIVDLETLLALIYVITGVIKSSILFGQNQTIKELHDKIASDWENLTDEKEIEILKTFNSQAKTIIISYVVYGTPAFVIFGCITYLPPIVGSITVTDYSSIFPYYFNRMIIHKDIYYYQVSFHSIFVFVYVGLSYLGIHYTFIQGVKHVCGIYTIASYRLQNAIESEKIREPEKLKKLQCEKNVIFNLIDAINKHREAIHGVNLIEQIFSKSFLVVEISALSGIAIVLVDITYSHNNFVSTFRILVVTTIFIVYIFYLNWAGQQVIQTSNEIYTAAYFVDWVVISIEARELVHMIIRRSCKPDKLTAGSFFTLSMENFGSILRASWSAATVLLSTQRSHK